MKSICPSLCRAWAGLTSMVGGVVLRFKRSSVHCTGVSGNRSPRPLVQRWSLYYSMLHAWPILVTIKDRAVNTASIKEHNLFAFEGRGRAVVRDDALLSFHQPLQLKH